MSDFISLAVPNALWNAVKYWCPEIHRLDGAIIAGGFIRAYYAGEKAADLDIYFDTELHFSDAQDELERAGYTEVFRTDKAVSYMKGDKKTQLIGYYFGNPETIIVGFDYTICSAAATFKFGSDEARTLLVDDSKLLVHKDFFEHLAGRILVYTGGSPLPLSSLKRMIKYLDRGYHICDENLIKLCEAIADRVDFTNPTSRDLHIAGMDPDGDRRIRVID